MSDEIIPPGTIVRPEVGDVWRIRGRGGGNAHIATWDGPFQEGWIYYKASSRRTAPVKRMHVGELTNWTTHMKRHDRWYKVVRGENPYDSGMGVIQHEDEIPLPT